MQPENPHHPHLNIHHPHSFERVDENQDEEFYRFPRLVVHVDDHFIETLGEYFKQHLPPDATILDLMSSYKTHLPEDYKAAKVVGLGLNTVEMQENDQLTEFVVHNLNRHPELPFLDNSFDVVLNTVSIQYLTRPVDIFREVARVLKPGGQHIVSFSNRMFPTKAVNVWRELPEQQRVELVKYYFEKAGGFETPEVFELIDTRHHSGTILAFLFNPQDPVYIVNARKNI